MIRYVRFLKPAEGISEQSLNAFRCDTLGPLVAGLQVELRLVRYVQTHRCSKSLETEAAFLSLRPGSRNDFVGLEEFWWKDERSALDALTATDGAFAKILQSQEGWMDPYAAAGWLAVDYPQVANGLGRVIAAPKSGIVRLIFAVSPSILLGEIKARKYWLIDHGPLIRSLAPARGALAYIQVHRQRDDVEEALRSACIFTESPCMGHAEAWFSDTSNPVGGDALAAVETAVMDERNFLDWSNSFVLVGKELVFVERNWL